MTPLFDTKSRSLIKQLLAFQKSAGALESKIEAFRVFFDNDEVITYDETLDAVQVARMRSEDLELTVAKLRETIARL